MDIRKNTLAQSPLDQALMNSAVFFLTHEKDPVVLRMKAEAERALSDPIRVTNLISSLRLDPRKVTSPSDSQPSIDYPIPVLMDAIYAKLVTLCGGSFELKKILENHTFAVYLGVLVNLSEKWEAQKAREMETRAQVDIRIGGIQAGTRAEISSIVPFVLPPQPPVFRPLPPPPTPFSPRETGLLSLPEVLEKDPDFLKQLIDMKQWPPAACFPAKSPNAVPGSPVKPCPRVFYPATPFILQSKSDVTRPMMVVFVQEVEGGPVKSRLVYASHSHGVLKILSQAIIDPRSGHIKRLDKGPEQHSSTLHSAYQGALMEVLLKPTTTITRTDDPKTREFFRNITGSEGVRINSYLEEGENQSFMRQINPETVFGTVIKNELESNYDLDEEFFHPEKLYLNDADSRYFDKDANRITDMDRFLRVTVKGKKQITLPNYGQVDQYTIESSGQNAKRYLVHVQVSTGKLWVAGVENANEPPNSYLVPSLYGKGIKPLTTPLLEKIDEVAAIGGGSMYSSRFLGQYSLPSKDGSTDMSSYLQLMPVVQVLTKAIQSSGGDVFVAAQPIATPPYPKNPSPPSSPRPGPAPIPKPIPKPISKSAPETGLFGDFLSTADGREIMKSQLFKKKEEVDSYIKKVVLAIGSYFASHPECTESMAKEIATRFFQEVESQGTFTFLKEAYDRARFGFRVLLEKAGKQVFSEKPEQMICEMVLMGLERNLPAIAQMRWGF